PSSCHPHDTISRPASSGACGPPMQAQGQPRISPCWPPLSRISGPDVAPPRPGVAWPRCGPSPRGRYDVAVAAPTGADVAGATPGGVATSESPDPAATFPARTVAPDDYDVVGELASGGMGRILRAWDRRHDRPVAIKVLLRPGADAARRFAREARLTARLQHPSIVPLYEMGRWSSGEPFYVM